MHDFQILFDHGERSDLLDPVYARYGKLGFPSSPQDRPWVYANFIQTLDGITSLLGEFASGSDIATCAEDRWLMDLLRAHADAVLLGAGTLRLEKNLGRPRPRGPVFRIVDPALKQLRVKLRRGAERNIFVSGSGNLQLSEFAVIDGDRVESAVITSPNGAKNLLPQLQSHPHVKFVVTGEEDSVDLPAALRELMAMGIRYLLCEGGPRLYGAMMLDGLIDEKFITVSPLDAGQVIPPEQPKVVWYEPQHRPTIFSGTGFTKERLARWEWISCRRIRDCQFSRYRRVKS
jgi:riboflavin biosynthesis pyrimidine reductase